MTKKYTLITDSGHSWLSVPIGHIRHLGIAYTISSCSYMSPTTVYLEKLFDMPTFLEFAAKHGWKVKHKEVCYEVWSGRNFPRYNPYFVINPLVSGSVVSLDNGEEATFYRDNDQGFIISESGHKKADSANYLIGLHPPKNHC